MIASRQIDRSHLRNTNGNGLTLGGDEDNLIVQLNIGLKAEQTRDHEFGTVAHCVYGAIFNDNTFIPNQQ